MDNFENNETQVSQYPGATFSGNNTTFDMPPQKKKLPSWVKALIIIGSLLLFFIVIAASCGDISQSNDQSNAVDINFNYDYIGVIYVKDTIDEYGSEYYNHEYTLNAIDAMMEDNLNKGIILYIDTPGGSVYASDELYLKIKEYRDATKRPVYSSMQATAASGGYYISAPCDKIFANRNCWTGSIGVTMGTFIDVSELLTKLGVKAQTITSGANKAMGSSTDPMTDQQRAIYQSLIDEAYEQFVTIVAEGRGMTPEQVKVLADGRIYTAKQAVENGLVDQIGTFDEAVAHMQQTYKLGDCAVEHFESESSTDIYDLFSVITNLQESSTITDVDTIQALIKLNGTYRISYISDIKR